MLRRASILIGPLVLLSCTTREGTEQYPFDWTVQIAAHMDSVVAHADLPLQATVRDAAGNLNASAPVEWTSTDPAIAAVDSDGVVHSHAPGRAWIFARARESQDSALIRVLPLVATLHITPADTFVAAGERVQLTAVLLDEQGDTVVGRPIAWSSTDSGTVRVDSEGVATPVVLDSALIEAKSGGASAGVWVKGAARFQWIEVEGSQGICAGVATMGAYCSGQPAATLENAYCIRFGGDCRRFNPLPSPVDSATRIVDAENYYSPTWCGLRSGTAYCWGDNNAGIVIPGSTERTNTIHPVNGLPPFSSLAVGASHACGLSAGNVFCWGDGTDGAIGDSTCLHAGCGPHRVTGISAVSLASSYSRSCVALTSGHVACWGWGLDFDWATWTWISSVTPVEVDSVTDAVAVAMNVLTACALSGAGEVWCWGSSYVGELGDGVPDGNSRFTPWRVNGIPPLKSLAAGYSQYCGLDAGGGAWCWGQAGRPEWSGDAIGATACVRSDDGYCRYVPAHVAPGLTFSALSIGYNTVCGMGTDGFAYCWGEFINTGRQSTAGSGSNTPFRAGGQAP